jgi:hypothetical protein
MFAAPIEGSLKDAMEVGETRLAGYEQSPPHQRTHAAEHHAKLIDCRGRYRRFRHANSLPNPTRAVLNMTPGISRSPKRTPIRQLVFQQGRQFAAIGGVLAYVSHKPCFLETEISGTTTNRLPHDHVIKEVDI